MGFKEIPLPFRVKRPILALGGQSKNTVCFTRDYIAYLSEVHGDLSEPNCFHCFQESVGYFLKKRPAVIACDLHPEYQSSKYASYLAAKYPVLAVQHHHSHIASCMAENTLTDKKVIGVAFDGTGWGENNTLWGAEFLCPCGYKEFKRAAHLREVPLLGGEMAIREPFRAAFAWLYLTFGENFLDVSFLRRINKDTLRILKNMYKSGFNAIPASSMGRLFDAVAALVLEKDKAGFEAELAVLLEKTALSYRQKERGYQFKIIKTPEGLLLDPLPLFRQITLDLKAGDSQAKIAWRFHAAIADAVKKTCMLLRHDTGINEVVLSGGVFQNSLLFNFTEESLSASGFKVLSHHCLQPADSSISLGQAAIANFRS
ncbi:MAG: hypothetical protein WC510_04650 [Candidatus Omnitrophota bacterium]